MNGADRLLDDRILERRVRAALARRLGEEVVDDLTATENLFDAGIASIDLVVALTQLERELHVEVAQPVPLVEVCTSIAATVAYLRRNRAETAARDGRVP
jgi:acyl carrier protein